MSTSSAPSAPDDATTIGVTGDPGIRWAGLAGMAFAVSVVVQNVWSNAAGVLPDPDADAAAVLEAFADAGSAAGVLVSWVAVNLALLVLFISGAHQRYRAAAPTAATVGLVGGVLLAAIFSMLQLPVVALAVGGDALAGDAGLVSTLWAIHGALFAFSGIALGLALAGLSIAAVRAGLAPRWIRPVGLVGAAVIWLASVPIQAAAEGEPATLVGVVGFLAWLLFLLVAGNRLRQEI